MTNVFEKDSDDSFNGGVDSSDSPETAQLRAHSDSISAAMSSQVNDAMESLGFYICGPKEITLATTNYSINPGPGQLCADEEKFADPAGFPSIGGNNKMSDGH